MSETDTNARKKTPRPKAAAAKAKAPRASARSSVYSSPQIIARRNRILDETRRMIGEMGIAGISMDEVAKRADVAKRTLYNAFQSKEHLIASAIRKYFEDYASHIDYSTEASTLEWMIERLVIVARRNLEIRNYTRALMNIYYSSDVDPEIRQTIHEIASKSHEAWIRELERRGELVPWLNSDQLIDMLVRYRYATAHAWTEGVIPEDKFVSELVNGFLTFMAGATIGETRDGIVKALGNLDIYLAAKPEPRPRKTPVKKITVKKSAAKKGV